jgi:hypothetical protein
MYDLTEDFNQRKTFIWCAFLSCTSSIQVLEHYFGQNGSRSIFNIESTSLKNMSNEVLLCH